MRWLHLHGLRNLAVRFTYRRFYLRSALEFCLELHDLTLELEHVIEDLAKCRIKQLLSPDRDVRGSTGDVELQPRVLSSCGWTRAADRSERWRGAATHRHAVIDPDDSVLTDHECCSATRAYQQMHAGGVQPPECISSDGAGYVVVSRTDGPDLVTAAGIAPFNR